MRSSGTATGEKFLFAKNSASLWGKVWSLKSVGCEKMSVCLLVKLEVSDIEAKEYLKNIIFTFS